MMLPWGEIFALLASVGFSLGPTFNTLAGRSLRVVTVNRVRLMLTLPLLALLHLLLLGSLFPFQARLETWFYLSLSAVLSLVIGDSLLFAAFAAIGTRQTMLISSLIPVFGALLAWLLLGETLTGFQAAGIGVIVLGVAWVALERTPGADVTAPRGMNRRGLLLAVGSAVFSALGAIASKRGLVGDFSALSAQMLRVLVALVVIALPLTRSGAWGRLVTEVRAHPEARQFLFWGALFGPLLGMWFSLLALQRTNVGIATALTSLPPIWLLLIGRFAFREQIGRRAVLGSLVAVAGVALMFVSGG